MNRNRWILAGTAVLVVLAMFWGYYMWPTATVVKPPAAARKAAPAKKAVVKPAPAATSVAPVVPTKLTTTVAAPVPTQTIVNNYYYSYSTPLPTLPTTSPAPAPPAIALPVKQQIQKSAAPARTVVNILSGNSFSLNFLSGKGSDKWNSGGSHREEVSSDEPQAP